MNRNKYKGTGVAIVTPFKNYAVDYSALGKVVKHVTKGGVQFIVALGSTGEAATISEKDQQQILERVILENKAKLPVVAGNFAGIDTQAIVKRIKQYDFSGINALLISSPAYVKPTQEGIYKHYMSIAEASPLPIIIYNVPGRTRSNIEWSTTTRLAKQSEKFIAIKEASGDLIQVQKILLERPDDFLVLSGDDELALPFVTMGGDGIISVLANALPALFSTMIMSGLKGALAEAKDLNQQFYNMHHFMYTEGNPAGVKAALSLMGICENELRLPLCAMSADNLEKLESHMRECGFLEQERL
jgi:4-hydroxy-tetrahydrodipicolinate synthase